MGGMFKKPKVPKTVEPTVVPMVQPEQVEKEKQRTVARARARGGRQSTMLSGNDTLG